MIRCLEKNYWVDSENAVAPAVILTLDHVSPPVLPFIYLCKSILWVFAPFCFGVFLPFVSLFPLAKRKSGWGICGSSLWCGCWFFILLQSICWCQRTVRPCTDVFTAYSHVRTEPLVRHRPNSRKKTFSPFFFTTLVPTQRGRCLLRSAWVSVMPEWLLSVISGILAGESPVSALSFVAFLTLLHGHFVLFRVVFVLLHFRWPYSRWHTRCHRASYFSELVAIPLLCFFPSNAVWLSPGRSTCCQACCINN